MIQLHIGPQTLVLPLQEVLCAPDPDSAVISAGGQVLAVTAEIKARHIPTVALEENRREEMKTRSSAIQKTSLNRFPVVLSYLERGGQQWMAESVLRDFVLAGALLLLLLFLGCRNFCTIAFAYETEETRE